MLRLTFLLSLALTSLDAQAVLTDPNTFGPALEIAHLYFGQWPTGIAVANGGRKFSNFPAGLDANNTNTGSNGRFQVAELHNDNTETAYPTVAINNPPGGAIDYSGMPPVAKGDANYLIGVQSVVIDEINRLWILDTGRAIDPKTSQLVTATNPGGAKLVSVDLATNKVTRTITFPPTVAYPDSYFNDVRFDLRSNLSGTNGSGIAYITDSSGEGRNGIVMVDLASGNSWRHLDNDPQTRVEQQFLPFVYGQPIYGFNSVTQGANFIAFGADGIAISPDGETLYFAPTSDRYMRSIPTAVLRMQDAFSEIRAQASVRSVTQKGVSDGLETDSNGNIYLGQCEASAVTTWNAQRQSLETFVRDPRINWLDTMSIAGSNLYFTVNQLHLRSATYPGTDRRQHPYVLFRAPLPDGGHKISLGGSAASNSTGRYRP